MSISHKGLGENLEPLYTHESVSLSLTFSDFFTTLQLI
jgi:hypothetical protein